MNSNATGTSRIRMPLLSAWIAAAFAAAAVL